jgi:peroxiredoxin
MYPHERSLVQKMEDKPFALVGINSDDSKEELKKAIEKEKMTWRSWYDGGSTNGPIATQWNVRGWPTLYAIDHKGVIRHKWVGSPGGEILDQELEKLVKEAEEDAKKKDK